MESAKGEPYSGPTLKAVQLHLRYTPAMEERDYDVLYSIDGIRLTFKKRYASDL